MDRLAQQIQFIIEIDKLKQVLRQTTLTDKSRQENSAEHSWHLAMMALVLAEYAPPETDILHAVKLLLVHDLVEIYAGDTFCYNVLGNQDKAERELQAANRLYGLLPDEQGMQLRALWEEFEAQKTPAALFATALDRLQPLLHNQQTEGGTWRLHRITLDQVLQQVAPIQNGAPSLWPFVQQVLSECVHTGILMGSSKT
jgi:putative hydrolases of HD superfamily